jgi:uncharacterized SAM-binding protein YcdF (DUF218 family)
MTAGAGGRKSRVVHFARSRWRSGLAFAVVLAGPLAAIAVHIWTFDWRWIAAPPLDAAIVLGAAAPGGTPSPVFAARLDFGATLVQSGAVRVVIVTGGGRDDPSNPEALAGVRYLRGLGIPAEQVLFEARSISTPENLCFAAEVGAANGLDSYAIVSDPLHLARAMRYAKDVSLKARPAGTPTTRYISFRSQLPFLLRETYKYAKRLVNGPVRCPPRA